MTAAILFDLDGTLVDSAPDLAAALNRLLAEEDLPAQPLAAIKRMVGDGSRKLVERGFAATGATPPSDALERFLSLYDDGLTEGTAIYPGVVPTLERLAQNGFLLSVCTNKPQRLSELLLERLDLARHFALVVGGDRFPRRKPDPLPIQESLRLLEAERGAMVGDSRNDVVSAQSAGLPAILVTYGYRRDPIEALGADAVVENFAAIPEKIDKLLSSQEDRGLGYTVPSQI